MTRVLRRRPVAVTYDQSFMQLLTRVEISANLDALSLDVECAWPDQAERPTDPPPIVSLAEIIAMRDPNRDVPRDISSDSSADATIADAAEILRNLAIDVLSGGGFGLMSDFVAWKGAQGDLGEGQWWGAPIYAELAESITPRTANEVDRDLEWQPIHAMVHRDPERAWPDILGFIERNPGSMEATMLLEDVMLEHGDSFIDRIEALALSNATIREIVAGTHLGGHAGPAIDRLEDLQAEIRGER